MEQSSSLQLVSAEFAREMEKLLTDVVDFHHSAGKYNQYKESNDQERQRQWNELEARIDKCLGAAVWSPPISRGEPGDQGWV